MDGGGRGRRDFLGLSCGLFLGHPALESFLFDFEFLLLELDALGGRSFADSVVPVLVDDGAARLTKGASQLGGTEFEKKH